MDSTLTELIAAANQGDGPAKEALFAALYSELHRMARRELGRHGAIVTLSTTTLLHEAYINIAGREGASFPDRAQFMGYAARVMRSLVIDHARNRSAQKRGGQFELTTLDPENVEKAIDERELIRVSEALDDLAGKDPSLAQLVDLKFFCGFSFAEIGTIRGVTERTVQRQWERARTYLYRRIRGEWER